MGSSIVVYYSRSGTTRKVAQEVARALQCDIEEIVDETDRSGALGWLVSGLQAILGLRASVRPLVHDLASYDLVFVGSPVWSHSVSSPVRTLLAKSAGKLKSVAFFVTSSGSGGHHVLRQMSEILGKVPFGELSLTARDLRGDYRAKVESFVTGTTTRPPRTRGLEALHAPTH